jgi:hypothetical protein
VLTQPARRCFGIPPALGYHQLSQRSFGIPPAAATQLRSHSQQDPLRDDGLSARTVYCFGGGAGYAQCSRSRQTAKRAAPACPRSPRCAPRQSPPHPRCLHPRHAERRRRRRRSGGERRAERGAERGDEGQRQRDGRTCARRKAARVLTEQGIDTAKQADGGTKPRNGPSLADDAGEFQ